LQTSFSIKYPLTIRISTIEAYRTITGFGLPNFRHAFPPAFRDQQELWLHCLPMHREQELAGLNYAAAFVSPVMGRQMQVSRKVQAKAVWKQATVIALAVDVLLWACHNPEVVTSSSSRALGKVALGACFNDGSFFELHEILQEVYESVIYNRMALTAIDLAPHLKSMPDPPPWNASRDTTEKHLQTVTTLWDTATQTVYGSVKNSFLLFFGEGAVTKKFSVTIMPDRARLAVYCINSQQNGPGGKVKWWDAQSIVSGSLNIRGTDGEYGAQAYALDDHGERIPYGDRVLTSNSTRKPDATNDATPGTETPTGPRDNRHPDGRPSFDPSSSQGTNPSLQGSQPQQDPRSTRPGRRRAPETPTQNPDQRALQNPGTEDRQPVHTPRPNDLRPVPRIPMIPPPPFYGPQFSSLQRKRPRPPGRFSIMRQPLMQYEPEYEDCYEYAAQYPDFFE
jgi:hypothetical protein